MKPITINTHIDRANNSKCCVRDILLATKQGAFESVFEHFLLESLHPKFLLLQKLRRAKFFAPTIMPIKMFAEEPVVGDTMLQEAVETMVDQAGGPATCGWRSQQACVFGSKPRNARPPLEGGDQPELDTAELCNDEQIKIGQLMWAVTLGRFDISAPVMLRQAPLCIYHMPLEDETLELEGCMIYLDQ